MTISADSDSDSLIVSNNVIRIQLRKPSHRKWELHTRAKSPGLTFPIIQLFDCDGNILVETNDDNISVSSEQRADRLKPSQSLHFKSCGQYLHPNSIKKSKSLNGIKYTKIFNVPKNTETITESNNKEKRLNVVSPSRQTSTESFLQESEPFSDRECSSYKSSDNDSSAPELRHSFVSSRAGTLLITADKNERNPFRRRRTEEESQLESDDVKLSRKPRLQRQNCVNEFPDTKILKSKSFNNIKLSQPKIVNRSKTENLSKTLYSQPIKKISFLDTYLKSLPNRSKDEPPLWCTTQCLDDANVKTGKSDQKLDSARHSDCYLWDGVDSDILNVPSDVAAAAEVERRLRMYRRGHSDLTLDRSPCRSIITNHDELDESSESSSESPDEADAVLNRLRRRIKKNTIREKKTHTGNTERRPKKTLKLPLTSHDNNLQSFHDPLEECRPQDMGSNISHHSIKGLTGRRARSSGDLCNGESKSPTDTAVYGSVVGEVMGWNRSLPNHLDGNRHLADDYSGTLPRLNNNYGENYRYQPKGVRAWRYNASKAGSEPEPVWKLQEGCDQGYASERSPEEDCLQRQTTYEEYEAQLRLMYPFITEENTFTVVVEKDGRGLGMSVCGGEGEGAGDGLVRIRRLYPPQPAWRTGQLAPQDLLLAANGVPLTGLSTYEALEVLRTTSPRVELRVCRPPPEVLDCLTPPAPPLPPARHTPAPPPDPLNCHPLHTRLSATTSSATTSSSEGRAGAGSALGTFRTDSPRLSPRLSPHPHPHPQHRPHSLRLPAPQQPLPVYDVQYGEFDIVMCKVNGSLGFTLRKEDHSALGHYVRALVREPALTDGRIQPGDRIVAVNDISMSGMSHADAVAFLRACGSEVRLRLYRDHAATPLSPLSPQESQERNSPSDSDTATVKPKLHLRAEAVTMLSDLAARRLTPDAVDGSRSPCLSPRKHRRLTRDSTEQSLGSDKEHYAVICPTTTDTCSESEVSVSSTNRHSFDSSSNSAHVDKQKSLVEAVARDYELQDAGEVAAALSSCRARLVSTEPMSMPTETSEHFAHNHPAYQSAVVHTNSQFSIGEGHKDDENGLKKWKRVTLSPDKERKTRPDVHPTDEPDEKENRKPDAQINTEPTMMTVELNRGWNSRLGFSIRSDPKSGQSYVSAIYSDSVAARDGRLRQGDIILQVNDENVTSMKTSEVIDLMRILRGPICITVLRPHSQ